MMAGGQAQHDASEPLLIPRRKPFAPSSIPAATSSEPRLLTDDGSLAAVILSRQNIDHPCLFLAPHVPLEPA